MTLQYRIRPKYEDQRWQHRVTLCGKLLLETIDRWCLTDAQFPVRSVVAGVLYLFSPRCDPYQLPSHRLCEWLANVVETPEREYQLAWPHCEESQAEAAVLSLTAILDEAVELWTDRGIKSPSAGAMAQRIAEEIVAQQYVVFHHYESTCRDINPFGI